MGKILVALACLGPSAMAQAPASAPSASGPVEFKLLVAGYGLAREPVYTEELVAIAGRVYVFASNSREVVVIEPAEREVDLLDIARRVQTEVSFGELDEGLARVKGNLAREVDRLEATGRRADAVEARMTRDLAEPRLVARPDEKARRVWLANSTVEVDADGEPDPDPARRALVGLSLAAVAKLGAFRTPNDLPPFVELEALGALEGGRGLRPTELSYLYRLAGPPRRFRRTYRLVAGPTDRDREAIRRVDRLRESAPTLRYEKYRAAPASGPVSSPPVSRGGGR